MRTPADFPRRLPHTSRRFRIGILVAIVVVIILLTSLRGLASFYTDYLWFQEVGFTSVFRGVLVTKVLLSVAFVAIFFVMMVASLTVADRVAPTLLAVGPQDELVNRYRDVVSPRGRWVRIVTSVIFALFSGVGADKEWNNWDLLRYGGSFGVKDPQYHKDLGFYVFKLPFIEFLLNWFFVSIIVVLIVTVVAHYLNGGIRVQVPGQRATGAVKTHVSLILAVLALIKGVDYYFERLELVLSNDHLVTGATATDVHANAPADIILILIAAVAAVLFIINIRQRGWTLPIVAVVSWILVFVILGGIYPAAYQALRVTPSELTRETPYLARNITATRTAYGINNVKVTTNYTGNAPITTSEVSGKTAEAQANKETLSNVPLLDPSQLLNTFDKYQALRNYYQFTTLGVDRYQLGKSGKLTQTLASARELNESGVPSGFVNQKLEYTHGYGAVVTAAGQTGVDAQGTPDFTLSAIPPTGNPKLTPTGSQIYYGLGSSSNGYVVADSSTAELDYEAANGSQVSTKYAGTGGVKAGSIFRRLAFALRFGDANMVLSGQINSSSRVMYIRNVADRVRKAAPFLKYDSDPYPVVIDGGVYYIQDAYTTTDNYPYAQTANTNRVPANSGLSGLKFNYIRNSVKVVVNAYTGKMDFFVMNTSDPIIKAYERAFPDLFKPEATADKLIPGITAHFRYPEDLFRVQTNMYGRYHLTNVSQFYTQGQAWSISQDPGSGPLSSSPLGQTVLNANGTITTVTARLQPEYILATLPGSTKQDFLSLQTFVPQSQTKQQNLTAFMTASADPSDYGQLNVYETPPSANVDGPSLIINAIHSNTAISQELTLLNQQGSQVLLGQVQVIPIEQTLLYIQPLYVQSSSNAIPSLKDVIVVYDGTAYHSQNTSLDAALCQVSNVGVDNADPSPFASYCNTSAANRQSTVPTTGSTGSSTGSGSTTTTTTPSTTTTVPSSSTVTAPPGDQTVSSLLTQAQTEFTAAQAALKNGDLATYQKDITQAQADVTAAANLSSSSSSTTTTTTPSSSTTTTPSSSTTSPTTAGS
jgi:uncharacterized membrane protein (UPF0182 family)